MKRLRISGLVKFVKRVRQELAGPVSPQRLAELRKYVNENIAAIERIAKEEGVRIDSLPLPSRKAYQYLKTLDLSSIATHDAPVETQDFASPPPESISFHGLSSHFDYLLDRLGRTADRSQRDEIYSLIRHASDRIEDDIRAKGFRPEQIKRQTREMRGWLAYFSQRENFDEYCAAVDRAGPVFRAACTWPAAKSAAFAIHFRPLHAMYRLRGRPDAVLVHLPTPMICFGEALLRSLAAMAFKRTRDKKPVHDAQASELYQRIASAMELLGGVVAQTRGLHHDLAVSFDRVNASYFHGAMSRPRLVWSRTFAARKFGHYDHAHDTVMVNMLLDSNAVPQYAVDFVLYHELLHRQLGVVWKSSRMAVHTPEFAARERQFQPYEQAKAALHRLARER